MSDDTWRKFAELLADGCPVRVDRMAPPGQAYAFDRPNRREIVFHSESERDTFLEKIGVRRER